MLMKYNFTGFAIFLGFIEKKTEIIDLIRGKYNIWHFIM